MLSVLDGVVSIMVSLMASKGEVEYDPSRLQPRAIADHIAALGK
jgi:copper chaperone CopZ